MGAPNVDEYIPGNYSIIKVSDFESPAHLAKYIKFLDEVTTKSIGDGDIIFDLSLLE